MIVSFIVYQTSGQNLSRASKFREDRWQVRMRVGPNPAYHPLVTACPEQGKSTPTMAAILTSPNAQTVLFRLNKDCAFSRDTGLAVGSMLGHGGSRPRLMMFPQNPHFLLLPFSGVFTFWTIWDLFGVRRRRVHSHFP